MPFELRPRPHPALRPEGEYLQTVWNQSVYPLAGQMGVPIKLPQVSPQPYSDLAFEGYQYARDQDRGNAYNWRVLTAFFQEGRDIGSVEVLTSLAEDIGLRTREFKAALHDRRYADRHREALRHAYEEARITAVPTFIIGHRRLQGLQSREKLIEAFRGLT